MDRPNPMPKGCVCSRVTWTGEHRDCCPYARKTIPMAYEDEKELDQLYELGGWDHDYE